MSVEDCLPSDLRGPETRVLSMSDGLSGAAVYRVEAGSRTVVLKVAPEGQEQADWHRALEIHRRAATAGLTPDVIHVDPERRATVTRFVLDQSFAARYRDPQTHEQTLAELGQALRNLHALPIPAAAGAATATPAPWTLLPSTWAELTAAGIGVPPFVRRGVEQLLAEPAPEAGRSPVLSHNDVHPKNLVHDGERLYLMDWDAAAANNPFYDLATIAVFLAMDAPACRALLGAYEGVRWEGLLPARFVYDRRLVASLCGVGFLLHGFRSGYRESAAAAAGQTIEETPTLGAFYQRMRTGALSLGTGEGCWAFGLALVRESVTPVA